MKKNMTITEWRSLYEGNTQLHDVYMTLAGSYDESDPIWITVASSDCIQEQLRVLVQNSSVPDFKRYPLWGIPFVVKDNIDVCGLPTTAACPAFAYTAEKDAAAVRLLKQAGAILVGKTNLDQFATGLVGTRSPYDAVPNSFDARYMSGGSSSGSAAAVAQGLVPFALGTDTAGSGRVPAGCNNIVGTKLSRGAISTCGVVPACRSMDCVSIFSLDVADALLLADILESCDPQDSYSRLRPETVECSTVQRIGVPQPLHSSCSRETARMFRQSCDSLVSAGYEVVPIDFAPLHELAGLLYEGPWIAERYAAVGEFLEQHQKAVQPTVRDIIMQGKNWSAVEAFRAQYRRSELLREIEGIFSRVQALAVPTVPVLHTLDDIAADPVGTNTVLGVYTNFVNLADLCAVSLPAGFDQLGLPFGLTFIAQTWQEGQLFDVALRWQQVRPWSLGVSDRTVAAFQRDSVTEPNDRTVQLAVLGAHMSGMELNHQLLDLNARFVDPARTAPCYRLFHLPDEGVAKPGMVRSDDGKGIELEVWEMSLQAFGEFSAKVPPPLSIGTIELQDGTWVKGFLCESWILDKCRDISSYGGWRRYLASKEESSG